MVFTWTFDMCHGEDFKITTRWWFKYFIVSPLLEEMIHVTTS